MRFKGVLFIVFVIMLSILFACAKDKDASGNEEGNSSDILNNESEMPIVNEPITLKFFNSKSTSSADDWNDVLIFNTYEEMTNINVEWEMIPTEGLSEKRNLALAGGSLPDAFHTAKMPTTDIIKYGEQGIFVPLNDLIEEHAPNIKKLFEEDPELEKAITMPDGNIYSLPHYYEPEFTSLLISAQPWIREDWLEQLEMDIPETTDEFYEYLKAVKETDLNGNGKHDEVPFGGTSITRLTNILNGAFGLQNKGRKHSFVDVDPVNDELRFIRTSEEYKQMLEYANKLWSEGLIEENIYSIEGDQYLANAQNNLYGSTEYFSPDQLFGEEAGSKFVGLGALEGPNGDQLYTVPTSPTVQLGAFLITSENKHPEATIRWVDYFFGDEGSKLFFMGVKDETFVEKDDGTFEYMDHITDSKDGLTREQEIAKYLTFPGGSYPGIVTAEFYSGSENSEMSNEGAAKLEPYLPDVIWPPFTYTADENKVRSTVGADIEKYTNEMRDKFITGEASFEEWDKYVAEIDKIGLQEYMEVYEAAYERYLSH